MIKVKYNKYYNDYRRFDEIKTFCSLDDFANWLFDMVQGDYKYKIWFVDPYDDHMRDGKLHLDNSCIKSRDGDWQYWIEQIEKDGAIIYSTGKYTNGICHWNDEIKQWLVKCRDRMNNPRFNFG